MGAFDAHRTLGFSLAGVAVFIFVAAAIARPGVLPLALSGVLVVQTTLLQSPERRAPGFRTRSWLRGRRRNGGRGHSL
jgi:hypothetical protein